MCHLQKLETSSITHFGPLKNKQLSDKMQSVLNSVCEALYFRGAVWNCYEAIANSKMVHSLIEA